MKKNLILFLIAVMIFGGEGCFDKATKEGKQGGQKAGIETEKLKDGNDYSFPISSYSKEIKDITEKFLKGDLSSFNAHSGKVKYYFKDFPLERYPLGTSLGLEIYPLSDVVEVGVEIGTTELRYLNKEKTEFDKFSYGKHEGDVFVKGYKKEPFVVRKIGGKKFKVIDFGAPRWNIDFRIYETFTKDFFISYIYAVTVFAGERPLTENEKTGEIVFNDAMQNNFKEIEKIISEIKW
ncbi:MAG: hypothetical protein ABIH69_04445 [bacterium]